MSCRTGGICMSVCPLRTGSERPEPASERSESASDRPELAFERPRQASEGPRGGGGKRKEGWTDGWMDIWRYKYTDSPCILQDFVPYGSLRGRCPAHKIATIMKY